MSKGNGSTKAAAAAHHAAPKSATAKISSSDSVDDDSLAPNANDHGHHDGSSFNAGGSSNGTSFVWNGEAVTMDTEGEAGKNDDDDDAMTTDGNATAVGQEATKDNVNEEEMKGRDWNYEYGEEKEEEEVVEVKEEAKEEDWNNVEEMKEEVKVKEEDWNFQW